MKSRHEKEEEPHEWFFDIQTTSSPWKVFELNEQAKAVLREERFSRKNKSTLPTHLPRPVLIKFSLNDDMSEDFWLKRGHPKIRELLKHVHPTKLKIYVFSKWADDFNEPVMPEETSNPDMVDFLRGVVEIAQEKEWMGNIPVTVTFTLGRQLEGKDIVNYAKRAIVYPPQEKGNSIWVSLKRPLGVGK